ncbi:hypothetical protein Dvina_03265 [Dactylosporangium vinaceum]|uniref:Tetratricopeptide repeat protein n=1 Tax=Dactylosporangium vinaceum TaxID=53362 RepID=A0ABV5M135_9ACTN|nr:hypothetical protein [Dactylosporangium vinaceum]UAB97227.1 hypothetical protein Dvina_03265 [Dactylosporangium vinaceum]
MTGRGPGGATLTTPIGPTDRGVLWRAERDRPGDRIVRLVDPRFCDDRFRDTLRRLRERPHRQAVRIVAEGWSEAGYAVEYALDGPMRTLGERLADCPRWTDRLRLLGRLCDALAQWQRDPQLHPGVGRHNLVFAADAATVYFLPCPAFTLAAPDDLFGLDAQTLAAVAPETVRGVPLHRPAQDRYALGTLAAQAIGCRPSRLAVDDAERIEAQARGALLGTAEDIEPFLLGTPPLVRLIDTIGRYRHPVPEARPVGVGPLRTAIDGAADPLALARELMAAAPDRALEVLTWAGDDSLEALRLAAGICGQRGDHEGALERLDRAVRLRPDRLDLRRERIAALEHRCPSPRCADLIADLEYVDQRDPQPDFGRIRRIAAEWRHLDDRHAEAEALYRAIERDGTDFELMYRYGECLCLIGTRADVEDLVRLARLRIAGVGRAGRLSEEGRLQWHGRFDALLDCSPPQG